jgi:hypothetical protein
MQSAKEKSDEFWKEIQDLKQEVCSLKQQVHELSH